MQLRSVKFIAPVMVNGRPEQYLDGMRVRLELDMRLGCVRVDGKHMVPLARVDSMVDGDELQCPECGKTFADAQGLGGHRRKAHGVKGGEGSE